MALLFGGVLMAGLAVDMIRFGATWREAAHLAATAAEAGAGWIDEAAAYAGEVQIDRDRADAAAKLVAGGPEHLVLTDFVGNRICVEVSIRVRPSLLAMVGAASKRATATSCAEPRRVP
ncbi:MAG TPA: hypothetical protein VK960_02580 [Acidimicrobiia bacterium]|nr:hypothetical protein [Acidimicrobiia bacterium]